MIKIILNSFLLLFILAVIIVFLKPYNRTSEEIMKLRDSFIYTDLEMMKKTIGSNIKEIEFKNLLEFNEKYSQKIKQQFYCYYLSGSKKHYVFVVKLESKNYKEKNAGDYLLYDNTGKPVILTPEIKDYVSSTYCE